MKRPLLNSTFSRMMIGYVLVAVVLASAWLYSLSGPLTRAVIRQQERNLRAVAQSAMLVVAESNGSLQQLAKELVARTDLRLTIVAEDGKVLADSDFDPADMENHADRPEVAAALKGETGVDQRLSATGGYDQVYVAVPGSFEGRRVAVRIAQSLQDVSQMASGLRRFGLSLLALALALSVLIAWRATRSAAEPVNDLVEVSRQMAEGNLSVQIPEVPADLQGLSDSLARLRDQMKSRLDALDAERNTLQSALDGIDDAVVVFESDIVAIANRAAMALPTSGPPISPGLHIDEITLPAALRAAVRDQLRSPEPGGIELEPDPLGKVWRISVAALQPAGSSTRAVAIVGDVTERSRLERVRREFVANASHELKTPVAAIKLLAESAEMASSDGDEEAAKMFSGQIVGEVARLQRLVGDLLDLSRLEALPAPDSLTDLRTAVGNAIIGHRSAAVAKGLALEADFSAVTDTDVYAAADPTDIAVALDNLLGNAISYTDEGSVRVSVTASSGSVFIEVRDTGAGIAPEHLPRIFERFYRVDEGRARDAGGTGLGLSLVRHVVDRNGGTVNVTSEVGVGSTFVLKLPRQH